jgi:predicted thioesterase
MPVGLTVQDCVAVAPSEVVAVTVKELEARDCDAVGVHVRLSLLNVAPVGDVVNVKLTVPPEGSSAARV